MHSIALAILIIAGSMAVAVGVQLLVHRKVPLPVLEAHHTVAGHMMALVGGMFGILLAFSVVVVWEQYDRAREGAAQEANASADLVRLVRSLPAPRGPAIGAEIFGYLQSVIESEWVAMEVGAASPATQRELDDVWRVLGAYEPEDDRTRNLQLVALGQLEQVADRRRFRLLHASRELPALIWAVLVVGGLLTVGYANFFGLRYRRSQTAMVASLAGLIALVLVVIWMLDHPYRGGLRIQPIDFRAAIQQLGER